MVGSMFRVQARLGALGSWYENILTFHELGLSSEYIDRPGLGQGFKGCN